jgi:tetratricopeptide (TPR) repeat protein
MMSAVEPRRSDAEAYMNHRRGLLSSTIQSRIREAAMRSATRCITRYLTPAAIALFVTRAPDAGAQSAADHIAMGDSLHTAMNPAAALKHYEAALAIDPKSYTALIDASRDAVDVAEFTNDKDARFALFHTGEQYARRAIDVNPQGADGHFDLARALGRTALSLGPRDKVKYATDVRAHALEALKLDPNHPGALHVMGMWNAEVMRLNGPTRWIAKNVLGGQVFGSASWKNAVQYMEKAVAVDPSRITHRIDLAEIYRDTGDKTRARQQFQAVLSMPATDYNDRFYKQRAEKELREL